MSDEKRKPINPRMVMTEADLRSIEVRHSPLPEGYKAPTFGPGPTPEDGDDSQKVEKP